MKTIWILTHYNSEESARGEEVYSFDTWWSNKPHETTLIKYLNNWMEDDEAVPVAKSLLENGSIYVSPEFELQLREKEEGQ